MYSGDLSDLVLITTPPSLGFLGSSDAEKKTKLMPSTSESNAEVENSHAKSVPHQVDISPTPLTPPTSPKGLDAFDFHVRNTFAISKEPCTT